ncbi:GntR family transcriptional regulator [Acetobacter sacchari]|uniref:GntR family transcriptional regulator n=1 Tax=Acetobacter sacchari TaxID=2661687 RepID=UPI00311CA901
MDAITLAAALTPDPDDRKPLYIQVNDRLRALIDRGTLRRGDAIPAERDLAEMIGVSRVTVRKAFVELVEAGVLIQKKGAGTFVAGRIEQPLSRLLGFSEDMRARGFEPGSVWLRREESVASPDEAMALGIAPHAPVLRLKRIRMANGQPMAIETAVMSAQFGLRLQDIEESLYDAVRKRDLLPVRALQRIRARMGAVSEIELLHLEKASAVLAIERRSFLADGRVLEVTFSCYRADLYDFVVELRGGGEGR